MRWQLSPVNFLVMKIETESVQGLVAFWTNQCDNPTPSLPGETITDWVARIKVLGFPKHKI
jgi:hypothetical protein